MCVLTLRRARRAAKRSAAAAAAAAHAAAAEWSNEDHCEDSEGEGWGQDKAEAPVVAWWEPSASQAQEDEPATVRSHTICTYTRVNP